MEPVLCCPVLASAPCCQALCLSKRWGTRCRATPKDQRLNLGSLAGKTILTDEQRAGTFVVNAGAGALREVLHRIGRRLPVVGCGVKPSIMTHGVPFGESGLRCWPVGVSGRSFASRIGWP